MFSVVKLSESFVASPGACGLDGEKLSWISLSLIGLEETTREV